MIQAPQIQYVPQQHVQAGYPQSVSSPVQYQNVQYPDMQSPYTANQGSIYNYPVASSYLPVQGKQKPQYNGVNLEILNPQGQGGYGNAGGNYQSAPALNHAQYNGVNIEILNPQGQGGFGAVNPNLMQMPAQFYPLQQPPLILPPQLPSAQPSSPQMIPPFIPQQNIPPTLQTPINTNVQQQDVPPPVIQNQGNSNPPMIDTPSTQTSQISPEAFAGRLNTDDLDAQQATIEEIAEKVKNSETDGPVLLDTQIFDALVNVINKDTSNLQGPSPEAEELRLRPFEELTEEEKQKADLSPLEKAGVNKQYALYTISFMQERLNRELEKRNGQALELKDLPCIDKIVETAKSNPEPLLRSSAIAGLAHIARPEYAQDLMTIFELAKNDEDESVVDAATKASEKLVSQINMSNLNNLNNNVEAQYQQNSADVESQAA